MPSCTSRPARCAPHRTIGAQVVEEPGPRAVQDYAEAWSTTGGAVIGWSTHSPVEMEHALRLVRQQPKEPAPIMVGQASTRA